MSGPADGGVAARRAVVRWAMAAVPPRVAPAAPGAGAAHRRGGRDHLRVSAAYNLAPSRRRRVRHRQPSPASSTGRPDAGWTPQVAGGQGLVRHGRRDRPPSRAGARARSSRSSYRAQDPAGRLRRADAGAAGGPLPGRPPARSRSPTRWRRPSDRRSAAPSPSTDAPGPSSAWSRTRATSTTSSPWSPRPTPARRQSVTILVRASAERATALPASAGGRLERARPATGRCSARPRPRASGRPPPPVRSAWPRSSCCSSP